MRINKLSICIFAAVLALSLCGQPNVSLAVTADELKQSIAEKARAAAELENQKQEALKKLNATQGQTKTLSNELKKIDYNISQLNLGIKSSQINIEKLGLEVQSLQLDINDINSAIGTKRTAVVELVRELYMKDRQGLLALILKNKSLAASFQEGQNIASLNNGLSLELQNLKQLNEQMNSKLKQTTDKKQQITRTALNLQNQKVIVVDQKGDRQSLLAQTKEQEKLYQQQISALEKQQQEIDDQIDSIETELRKSFNESLLPAKRHGMFDWPVANPVITQHFGEVTRYKGRLLYNGKPHNGEDFGVPIGTPIYAVDDGTISAIGNNGRYQYGKYVLIHHPNNLATLYAHLSRNNVVKAGDEVKKGQVIGYSGNTGYAVGNGHLHLGLYWDDPSLGRNVQLQDLPSCRCGLVPIGITLSPEDYLPSNNGKVRI